jgi:ADP-heptose:LPS heptosyltransferase
MTVVALRALGIGDLATAVPALRGLRAANPGTPLVLLAPAWLRPLVELTGAVDRVVALPGLDTAAPRLAPPAVAVNLHGRGPRSHHLLAALHPGRLLGFCGPGCPDGPQWIEQEHEVHRWCRMLGWYGISAYPGDLDLYEPMPPTPSCGTTIVHPGAKSAERRWPAHRFAQVARRLAAEGHDVVVTGSPRERNLARRVAHGADLPDSRVLAGRIELGELAALVASAHLVVCGDTGIAHLATGYRTPSVVLFGRVSPLLWGPPPNRPQHRTLWHPQAASEPATHREHATPYPELLAITVDEVLAAAAEVCRTTTLRSGNRAVNAQAR